MTKKSESENGRSRSYFSLFITQFGQKSTISCFQMCCTHADLFAGFNDTQIGGYCNLIALYTPHFQHSCIIVDQIEFGFLVE